MFLSDMHGPKRSAGPRLALLAFAIAGFAVALRWGAFGNANAGLDEQFYLLVGDRMWSGGWPYLDIWDRKPAGLFLLYAGIRALPGDGVLAYQLIATAALAATGIVAAALARQVLPRAAACACGLAIVFYGVLLGMGFGEAPIFYDLLTVIAGALVLARLEQPRPGLPDRRALTAMALCGLAITLKTSAVFEGGAFGLLLLHADWREAGRATAVRRGAAYLAIGVAPTAGIAAVYAAHGGLDAFVFANVLSVFQRNGGADAASMARGLAVLLMLLPLIVPALVELRHLPAPRRRWLAAWLAAGLLSFVAVGHYYEHYALPLVTPLALAAAHGLRRRAAGWIAIGVTALAGAALARGAGETTRQDIADLAALTRAIPPEVKTGCLFVYEGPLHLYRRTGACLPGRYVFPGHFTEPSEDGALERPSAEILRDTLARRPAAIVMSPDRRREAPSANDRLLRAVLIREYRPVASRPMRLYGSTRATLTVWRRR